MQLGSESARERIWMQIAGRTRPLALSRGKEPVLSSAGTDWQGLRFELHRMQPVQSYQPVEAGPMPGDFGLLVILEGEIELHSRDDGRLVRETGRQGSVAILAGDALRRFERLEGTARVAAINISPAWVERAELTDRLQRMRFVQDETVRRMTLAIGDEVAAGVPSGSSFAQAMSLALLDHVFDRYGVAGRGRRPVRGQLSASQQARLGEHVRANLASDLSLASLAAEVGVSPRHFVTLFRRAFGTSPHRFVLEQRVEAGERMIAQGERDLAAIALTVGFSSQSHFTTAFRSARGTTPARFARGFRVL
jgi:AraC family transcriptional regulator